MPEPRTAVPAPSARDRFRYWFDNVMARGTVALMGLLAVASLAFIALVALVVVVLGLFPEGSSNLSFFEVLWGNLMRTLDSGTMGGDAGWGFRTAMLVVTISGVIIVASLIGIISSAFDTKVAELRKGRSTVLEHDHTLILGWSSKVFPIVNEICEANESRKGAVIVVLADHDKVEMEDELRAKVGRPGKTRIIVRSGDPMDLTDLEIGNPHTARSIIVIAPEGVDDPDSVVIKTTLALTNNPRRTQASYHIVGEIQDPRNLEAARLVGRDEAHWVLAGDLISRITVQTCRQSGLSVVYTELLDFSGDEIYFTEQPTLVGRTYFDAQLAFADSAVMGLVKAGTVMVNPPASTPIEAGDEVIVIAEDDSTIRLGEPGTPDVDAIGDLVAREARPESTLVLGANSGLAAMLSELDEYVAQGSTVTVVAEREPGDLGTYTSTAVTYRRADPTSRAALESLDVPAYDHIIVLADGGLAAQRADARTLITLLHLREIGDAAGVDLNVVSEMLDDRNRELAEVTNADDFIVSDKLIALMLSQISENKQLTDVFATLFSSDGSEIYLRPAELYVRDGVPVDFYTVLEAARRRGETAIGFRLAAHAHSGAEAYGVTVNPAKGEKRTFTALDKIIVLAED
ncbi:MAG: potassium transporter TrkA [Cellulomonadaceae bacterium]|nr:potassium transporter TrkA [Cellulomonadaceae bacterium]